MSIIQDIRDKYARISVIAIALALIGFILTDYVQGSNRGRGAGGSSSVGSVNGKKINAIEFENAVKQSESQFNQQGSSDPMSRQRAVDEAWRQQVNQVLLDEEFERIGMRIGKKERGDILYGPNAPEDIKKAGIDEKTGQYDPARAKQQVDQKMRSKQTTQAEKDQINLYIRQLELQRKTEKYAALFTNSSNTPRWFVEKETADNNLLGKISLVNVFYSDSVFVDSTIKISDKEIGAFINKHKEDYKQEDGRSINYVTFSAAPKAVDSAMVMSQLALLKAEFDSTKDVATFLAGNGSPDFKDVFNTASRLPVIARDSIIKQAKNGVYGPYLDGNNYVLAKLVDSKMLPDSAKARHILVKTYDPQQQQQLMEDAAGKNKIDSIVKLINGGARFDSLAMKLSDDLGSGANGGLLESPLYQGGPTSPYFPQGAMVKEFNDFCFEGKVGEKKVVKTVFGYHYIEILDQKNPLPQYKVAYLNQEIFAGEETDRDALQAATNFAGDSKDQKTFDTAFEKTLKPQGLIKGSAMNIRPGDAQVQGMVSRNFVKNIYSAKRGEVLKPESINNRNYKDYVVAIVIDVQKEGTQPIAKARPFIEPTLRNRKKAEMMRQKLGKITTLEAAAAAWGKPIETVDSLRMKTGSPLAKFGTEPKVFGATFNPANKGKVVPEALEGQNGIYVIRVENVSATAATAGTVEEQRKQKYQQAKQSGGGNLIEALKKAARIKDKRTDIY